MNEQLLKIFIVITLSIITARGTFTEFRRHKVLQVSDIRFWFSMITGVCLAVLCLVILFNWENTLNNFTEFILMAFPIIRYGVNCIRDFWNLLTQDVCHVSVHFMIGRFKVRVKGSSEEARRRFVFTWFTQNIPEFSREQIMSDVEFSLNDLVKLTIVGVSCAYIYIG